MKNLLLVLCFCSTTLVLAQMNSNIRVEGIGNSSSGDLSVEMLNKFRQVRNNRAASLNAEGSPYLNNSFLPTKIYYSDSIQGKAFYRFNAYNQEIEIKQNSSPTGNLNALSKDKKIAILVDGKKMSFKTFITDGNKTINGYLVSLIDGDKYDLYKRVHVIFSLGRPAANSFIKAVPNRLTQFTEYYYQKKGMDRIDFVSLNNRKISKIVDDSQRAKIKSFIKDNDLNLKKESDLIKAFEFLNE